MISLLRFLFSTRAALVTENPSLRKQLAMFREREIKPKRTTLKTRLAMILLARFFEWRNALMIVRPEAFVKWHRTAFRALWRWKSRKKGRPPLPRNLRELIRDLARENPIWGEQRIADELKLKLGIRVSPRTVRKYLNSYRPRGGSDHQRWATFVRNHAKVIVACDFFMVVTTNFRTLYAFVAMEISSRRILHCNVTDHPTAAWTAQQFPEILADDHPYRFMVHDRDSTFSFSFDQGLKDFGVRVLRTPVRAPTANIFCERLIGTIRRECLDYLIPISQRHLRLIIKEFVVHYNRGRPHSSLGLAFRNQSKRVFRPASIGICFPPVTG